MKGASMVSVTVLETLNLRTRGAPLFSSKVKVKFMDAPGERLAKFSFQHFN